MNVAVEVCENVGVAGRLSGDGLWEAAIEMRLPRNFEWGV